MTKQQFYKLNDGNKMVQPNYPEYSNKGFRVLSINLIEGLVEINEVTYFYKTKWYRFENLSMVTYSQVLDKETFEVKRQYKKY